MRRRPRPLAVAVWATLVPVAMWAQVAPSSTRTVAGGVRDVCHADQFASPDLLAREALIADSLERTLHPATKGLLDLACVRLGLVPEGSPPESVTFLAPAHSTWGAAALRAASAAHAEAPDNMRPLEVLARIAVPRASGRLMFGDDWPRDWGDDAVDLPAIGPPPDVTPVLQELAERVEADSASPMISRGCVALALALGRHGHAHHCAVLGVARTSEPAWHLARLAWLNVVADHDAVAASEVSVALDWDGPGLAREFSPRTSIPVPQLLPGELLDTMKVIAPRGWAFWEWKRQSPTARGGRATRSYPLVATGRYIRDPATGAPVLVLAARLVAGSKVTHAEGPEMGHLAQWWWGTDIVSRVDSVRIPVDSTVVVIVPAIHSDSGVGGWDLGLEPGSAAEGGAWQDRLSLSQMPSLQVSDLLLGGTRDDGIAHLGHDSVRISPAPRYRPDAMLQLAFQVTADSAADSAVATIDIQRVDKPPRGSVHLGFPVLLTQGRRLLQYAIDLRVLGPGDYRLVLTVTGGDARSVTRSADFTIVGDR